MFNLAASASAMLAPGHQLEKINSSLHSEWGQKRATDRLTAEQQLNIKIVKSRPFKFYFYNFSTKSPFNVKVFFLPTNNVNMCWCHCWLRLPPSLVLQVNSQSSQGFLQYWLNNEVYLSIDLSISLSIDLSTYLSINNIETMVGFTPQCSVCCDVHIKTHH